MEDQSLTIGKNEACDIYVGGRYTEPVHARLRIESGTVSIEDHKTQFGTFVNGKWIQEQTELKPGDKVKIGTQLLDWESYTEGVEVAENDPNPIYFKDLFTYHGQISKSNYRFILLFTAVAPLVIFFGVPAVLLFLENRMGTSSYPDFLIELLWFILSVAVFWIFLMQSIKRYRTMRKE
jgi:hypothetical protein